MDVSYDEYVEKVLPELISFEHPVNMPEWFVPETYYYLWDDGHLVGEFRIRHHLTQALRTGAGHIGYSILKGVAQRKRRRDHCSVNEDKLREVRVYSGSRSGKRSESGTSL